MALGKKSKSCLKSELGFVKCTRALGRKRIGISNNGEDSNAEFCPNTPLKRQRSGNLIWGSETSALEALPQEILIKIVCGVDHEDLKQLFHVSKAVRQATLIAKEWHFAYSTPSKTRAFRTAIEFPEWNSNLDEIEAPNAPKQWRLQRPLPSRKTLDELSVNLFASWDDEEQGTRKGLFMDEDV